MWTPVYFVRYIEFPAKVEGVTIPNDDGTFDIYINSIFSEEKRSEILEHELRHIRENHFYNDILPIREIEQEACGIKHIEPKKKPQRLPDVLFHHPDGQIACFHSLESLGEYTRKYAKQRREEQSKAV